MQSPTGLAGSKTNVPYWLPPQQTGAAESDADVEKAQDEESGTGFEGMREVKTVVALHYHLAAEVIACIFQAY